MNDFLTAEWRKLAIVNYVVAPDVLLPFVPARTALDFYEGKCYVSLVGFMFVDTRVAGIAIPFHRNFEEVNLRFYVTNGEGASVKRGVVFIKEIVPRRAITFVANTLYREKYETLPMAHDWMEEDQFLQVRYKWKKHRWHELSIKAGTGRQPVRPGTEEDFITNHYWGYTQLSASATSEYEVTHPVWDVYPVIESSIDVDFAAVYGHQFGFLSQLEPESVFLAEGSLIAVKKGRRV